MLFAYFFFFLMLRLPPRSTLFPDALPILAAATTPASRQRDALERRSASACVARRATYAGLTRARRARPCPSRGARRSRAARPLRAPAETALRRAERSRRPRSSA